jgi:hypothetical protein
MKKADKLTTYQQVCEAEGVDPVQSLPFPTPETPEQVALNGMAKAWRIVRVFNKGVKPDFDTDQAKYTPWWYMRSEAAGGPGFSYYDSDYVRSFSFVGARLVFLDYDVMKWVTSQPEFVEIFKSWMTI